MIPRRIQLEGFLSYRQEVQIDFSHLHLACIAGPNGAGKSTLLDAITWSLFGQARRRDDSLIHNASEAARVVFEFEYEGNCYRVQRAKKRDQPTMLEFHLLDPQGNWRPLTGRTLRDTEALIEETLHLDYDTFISAAFFLQGKADHFSQQRPAERKRVLGSILGLDGWEGYRQAASDRRRGEETELAVLDARLDALRADLATEDDRKAALAQLQELLRRQIEQRQQQEAVVSGLQRTRQQAHALRDKQQALDRQLSETNTEQAGIQARLTERQQEMQGYQSVLARREEVRASFHAWQTLRAEADRLSEIAARAHELVIQRQTLEAEQREARIRHEQELTRMQERLDQLQRAASQESELLGARSEKQAAHVRFAELAQRKNLLETEREEALRRRGELLSEVPRLRQEMDELKARIEKLQVVDASGCPLCEQDLSPGARKTLIDRLQGQGAQLGDRYREDKALLKEVEDRLRPLEAEVRQAADAEAHRVEVALEIKELDRLIAEIQQNRPEIFRLETSIAEAMEASSSGSYAAETSMRMGALDQQIVALGYDADAHETARRRLRQLQAASDDIRTLEKADASVRSLSREIDELKRQDKILGAQVVRLAAEVLDISAELSRSEEELVHLAQAERLLADLLRQENETRRNLGAAERGLTDLETLRTTLGSLEQDRQQRAGRLQTLRRLEAAFGHRGVPALLIEQSLPEIESRANEILELLTEGTMSVRLVTQQAYKDQTRQDMRETLDILISDGQGMRDYSLFSGGERFRVDFAIRLALSKVLAQRAGARLQMLVIDEGFGSQDEVGRQKLVEAVNRVQGDFACILVITHIDALKDVFPTRIEIAKTPQGSTAQVV